jgi:hypothetical protein
MAKVPSWTEYRRARRRFVLVWLGGTLLLACSVAVVQVVEPSGRLLAVPGPLALAAALAVFIASGVKLAFFPCPRCQQPFFARFPFQANPFRQTCINCGLHKWSTPDA